MSRSFLLYSSYFKSEFIALSSRYCRYRTNSFVEIKIVAVSHVPVIKTNILSSKLYYKKTNQILTRTCRKASDGEHITRN